MTALRRVTVKVLSGAFLALLLATPAAAQNSDAPIDVTAAPPPSAETVGPSQLRDFSLQGTVTRPADRAGTSTPTPSVIQAPPPPTTGSDSGSTSAGVSETAPPASVRSAATASPRSSPGFASVPGSDVATPSTPLDVTTDPAPLPLDTTVAPDADTLNPGPSYWPWVAALVALVGGVAFIGWSLRGRRGRYADPGRMAFAGLVPDVEIEPTPAPARPQPRPDPVPPRAQPAPRPAPAPAPAAKPAPAPTPKPAPQGDGLIVSTALKPQLNVQFTPDRAVVTDGEVMLQFDVVLSNTGSAPARDVLVHAEIFTAHSGQDQEIASFFQSPMADGDRMTGIPPLGKIALKTVARLPLSKIHSFEAGGRRLFVPLIAFNILFRSGAGEGQASASFLVGRGNDDDEKLAPFRLDLGPRVFRGLSARPHSMGLQRQSA